MSLPSTLKSHWKRLAVLVLLAGVGLLALRHGYGIARWRLYIWLPSYLATADPDAEVHGSEKQLIFLICDHYDRSSLIPGTSSLRHKLNPFAPRRANVFQ